MGSWSPQKGLQLDRTLSRPRRLQSVVKGKASRTLDPKGRPGLGKKRLEDLRGQAWECGSELIPGTALVHDDQEVFGYDLDNRRLECRVWVFTEHGVAPVFEVDEVLLCDKLLELSACTLGGLVPKLCDLEVVRGDVCSDHAPLLVRVKLMGVEVLQESIHLFLQELAAREIDDLGLGFL